MINLVTDLFFRLTTLGQLLVALAAALSLLGLIFVLILFSSRAIKTARAARTEEIKVRTRKIVTGLVMTETFQEQNHPIPAFVYQLTQLRHVIKKSDFNRQIVLDQIIDLKKSLSGNALIPLSIIYNALKLHEISLRKLSYSTWYHKAQAIRELSEMQYRAVVPMITKYVNSSNSILRQETIVALLQLSQGNPLVFLNDYKGNITLWMRINLHRSLQRLDFRKLPTFSDWFTHENESVVLFCLSMTRAFRQLQSLPELVKLLYHQNERIVALAIKTISVLGADEYCASISGLIPNYKDNKKILLRIVRALGNIGTAADREILLPFLRHGEYELRFEAMKSMKKLGIDLLTLAETTSDAGTRRIANHLTEPLLN